jgi:fructan beta-fructosidase
VPNQRFQCRSIARALLQVSLVALLLSVATLARAADDLLIADFESETYGDWTVEGEAFGPGPAAGTLPGQMQVSGYLGERLVNSFYGGDNSTGTLTSPSVTIERPYMNFLIGGGGYPGETCINLVRDGEVVRTATGPNDEAGGSEQLDWHTWDVRDLQGKSVVIQIVDRRRGGWGHINVDHIVQTDRRMQEVPLTRQIKITKTYLHLPIENGAKMRRLVLLDGDRQVRALDIELADAEADWWAFIDVDEFAGRELTLSATLPEESTVLEAIRQSDDQPAGAGEYNEPLRPQFHFTTRRGWINDPNGLVHFDGEWHLYYQHNPVGWNWGNMHWGHAVSKDLLHWRELQNVFHPWGDTVGAAFSGSAVVDHQNTSGFGEGGKPPIVAALTDTGSGEIIAFSNDRGRSFTMYEGNPVVEHQGRDPKVMWHAPTGRWVMAVYNEAEGKQWIAFYTSPDLKQWSFASRIEGFYECPDLFELPVDGDAANTQWVLHAADGKYLLGEFDGRAFHPHSTEKQTLWYGDFYAAQSYDNAPDGRRIQIGWGRGITFPGMPFNQQMCIPVELTLRSTPDGVRMFAEPIIEAARRDVEPKFFEGADGNELTERFVDVGELLEVHATIDPGTAGRCGVEVRGQALLCDLHEQTLTVGDVLAPLVRNADGHISLRILVDRGSVEVFVGGGQVAISHGVNIPPDERGIRPIETGGKAAFWKVAVRPLQSIWRAESGE